MKVPVYGSCRVPDTTTQPEPSANTTAVSCSLRTSSRVLQPLWPSGAAESSVQAGPKLQDSPCPAAALVPGYIRSLRHHGQRVEDPNSVGGSTRGPLRRDGRGRTRRPPAPCGEFLRP